MSKMKRYENRQSGYTHAYLMEYLEDDGAWTVYCREHPSDPHKKSVGHTHLYDDDKLCRTVPMRSFEEAEAFAHWWIERYSTYLRTGEFPMTKGSVRTRD